MESFDLFNSFFNSSFLEGSFSNEEKVLCSLIYQFANEKVCPLSDSIDFECEGDTSFQVKIEATKKNLKHILHLFEEAAKARRKFIDLFPDWQTKRRNNVLKIRELADRINTDRFNCNISTVTASSVGVLGGITLASALVFPPAALILGVGGGVATALGGAVAFGTSVTEVALRAKCMSEAKDVLSQDEENFKLMGDWFKHSQDLIDAIEKIIGYSLAEEIYNDLKNFHGDVKKLFSLKDGKLHSSLKQLIQRCARQMVTHPSFAALADVVFLIPIIITFFFIIVLLRKNNSLIFSSIIIGQRAMLGLMKLLDLSGDIGVMICNVVKGAAAAGTEAVSKATARMVAHGVFAGIGIALDVTNIVFSSIDIHNGSISQQAIELKSAADKLDEEYKVLECIYNELHSNTEK